MAKHFNIKISGRVQGVGFRWSAKERADRMNIKGLAQNEPDGTVWIEAEGEGENLEQFVSWCRRGPFWAKVEDAQVSEGEFQNYSSFKVL